MTASRSAADRQTRVWTLGPAHTVILVIAATTIVRVLLASSLGLGIDESYAVATGRHPQLSYFDHPPLAWWMAWGSARLFGTEAALAVRAPFIILFTLTTWLMFALTRLLFGERAGLWAALTLNLAPVLAWTSGSWVVPDGPLNAALLAGAYCAATAMYGARSAAPIWWLAAGAFGGLAMLSKLHGVFLFAGILLFLVTSRQHRHWLLSPWPYAGCALALMIFAPVIVWNAQHDWASIAFQSGRARVQHIMPWAPIGVLAGQAAYLLPWLWLPLVVSLGRALRSGPADDRSWLLACLAIGPVSLFTLVAWSGGRVFPHWAMPGYLFLFPLLGVGIEGSLAAGSRWVRYWLVGSAISLALIVATVITLAHLPWPPVARPELARIKNPLDEAVDWTELATAVKATAAKHGGDPGTPQLLIAATRWHEAGKSDYALRGEFPVICLCRDARGYGVMPWPADAAGSDVIIVGRGLSAPTVRQAYGHQFESIEELASVAIKQRGEHAFDVSLYLGHAFRGEPISSGQK